MNKSLISFKIPLIVFSFFLTSLPAISIAQPGECSKPMIAEMDERWKVRRLPEYFRGDDMRLKVQDSETIVEQLFRDRNFFSCPSKHRSGDQGLDGVFIEKTPTGMVKLTNKLPNIVLSEVKYTESKTPRLRLSNNSCKRCDGETEKCYQMSKRWALSAIEGINVESEKYCATCPTSGTASHCDYYCPRVMRYINESGINAVIRVGFLVTQRGEISTYAIGDTDAQLERSKDFITRVF